MTAPLSPNPGPSHYVLGPRAHMARAAVGVTAAAFDGQWLVLTADGTVVASEPTAAAADAIADERNGVQR